LSIHERVREIGLLRAVGASQRQMRSMVRAESVVIAVLGTFLLTEDEFDAAYARLLDARARTWADRGRTRPAEINHHDGGRGIYFDDPDGHLMEILTKPYGPA